MRLPVIAVMLILAGQAGWAGQAGSQLSSLQGRVVRWGTSEPIGKVSVELLRIGAGTPAPFVATTGGDGTFVFASVPPGQYRVTASRPGYVSAEYGQRWPGGGGRPLTLPAGQAVGNVPIPMLQTGAISGVVRDAFGVPLGDVEVQALLASYRTGRRVLTVAQTVQSDDRGEFRLFWLTPGKYFVAARHPDLSNSPIRAGGISVGGGGGIGRAPRYQSFRTGGDNAASSRSPFERMRPDKEKYMAVYYPNTTDEFAAAAIEVTSGGEARAIDFSVSPVPIRRVRGRVISEASNEPAMSARVQWVTPSGMSPSDSDSPMGPMQGATQVECCDGAFEMFLPQGTYTLVAATNSLASRVSVTVGENDLDGIVLAIPRSFSIKGTLTFEGRTPTPAELSAIRINPVLDPPVNGLYAAGYSGVLPSGSFTMQVARGDYKMSVLPMLPQANLLPMPMLNAPATLGDTYVKSIRLGNVDVLNGGLHLLGETTEPMEIVIGTANGVLEGRVVNREGQPVPNVVVALVPDAARRSRVDLVKSTFSDASGRFRLDRVAPGDYLAFAFDGPGQGDWQDPDYVAARESRGAAVRIGSGPAATVELSALTE